MKDQIDLLGTEETKELSLIETTNFTLHLNPSIPLKPGIFYRVEIDAKNLKVWECIANTDFVPQEPQ